MNPLANLSATGQVRLGDMVIVDINDDTQKLAFYRDDSEANMAAAAMDMVHSRNVPGDNRIAA